MAQSEILYTERGGPEMGKLKNGSMAKGSNGGSDFSLS